MMDVSQVFLTQDQSDKINDEVLNMQRHNVWLTLVRSDPDWPYRCLCDWCNR